MIADAIWPLLILKGQVITSNWSKERCRSLLGYFAIAIVVSATKRQDLQLKGQAITSNGGCVIAYLSEENQNKRRRDIDCTELPKEV